MYKLIPFSKFIFNTIAVAANTCCKQYKTWRVVHAVVHAVVLLYVAQ